MTDPVSTRPAAGPIPASLTIEVLTPCVVGADPGGTLEADLVSVVDAYGMPYIPRYRLAARLRDAALTVLQEAGSGHAEITAAGELFGASAVSDRQRRVVTIGHATLPRALQAGVVDAVNKAEDAFGSAARLRAAIRAAYTMTTSSTARDERGAPRPGTLRDIEAVSPGVILTADLTWATGRPTPAQLRFLARCVLALTQIGHGETDFRGRVDCALDGDRAATAALAFGEMP